LDNAPVNGIETGTDFPAIKRFPARMSLNLLLSSEIPIADVEVNFISGNAVNFNAEYAFCPLMNYHFLSRLPYN